MNKFFFVLSVTDLDEEFEDREEHPSEVEAANIRIAERNRNRGNLDERRRQVMGILKSGGALEHYARLQEEAGRAEAEVEGLRHRLATAERIESTKAELDLDRARLLKALQDDYHEREQVLTEAIQTIERKRRRLSHERKPA